MKILNLGCGSKTSSSKNVLNIDWSILLIIRKNFFLRKSLNFLISKDRKKKLKDLPNNILVHDLKKGIPFENNSVDVAYSSHVLEHIDRVFVLGFLKENYRVLKPLGIIRIVVPDLYLLMIKYLENYNRCNDQNIFAKNHDNFIKSIIEQSVRKEAAGTSKQKYLSRKIENLLLGDARKRGETHQWMYDKFNLKTLLFETGFRDIKVHSFLTSDIPKWKEYGLDRNPQGGEYKKNSLYIEAKKIISDL